MLLTKAVGEWKRECCRLSEQHRDLVRSSIEVSFAAAQRFRIERALGGADREEHALINSCKPLCY
jgi:hypothetical protein